MKAWDSGEDTRRCLSCQRELAQAAASEPPSWKTPAVETEDRSPVSSCGAATLQARAAHRGPAPLTHTCGSVGRNVCVFLCRAVLPGEQRNGLY